MPPTSSHRASEAKKSPLRILQLEDSTMDRELIQETLLGTGLACEFIETAGEAEFRAALEERAFELILADFSLPGYSGLAALVAARAAHPDVPFIFVSGAIGEELAVDCLKNGATDYVLKSHLSRLQPVILRALREAEERSGRRAAEALSRAKSSFVASMSHELRTPVSGVIGLSELLLDTSLNAAQREFVEMIRSSANTLLTVINDVLDFSKIEAGKLSLQQLDFDLIETIENVLSTFADSAERKGLELAVGFAPRLPRSLRGDPARLRQVLINLVGNAIKFTERGEVVVRAVSEVENETQAVVRITVSDTGAGIPADFQGHLFQAFSQAKSTVARQHGGTGLGLTIARQLVALMGGEIGVESKPGGGSTFWFTACFEKQVQAPPAGPVVDDRRWSELRVLVVDDNPTSREILGQQLATWAVKSDGATDVDEAVTRMTTALRDGRPYDVVLADMQLPAGGGFALVDRIRSDTTLAKVRIVGLVSLRQTSSPEALTAAGLDAQLLKPVRQSRLYDCLAGLLAVFAEDTTKVGRAAEAPPSLRESELRSPGGRPVRILLAEDNPVNQRVTISQLQKLGCSAEIVTDGKKALAALERSSYDIVLMDCEMPEMDGYEATRLIRSRERAGSATWPTPAYIVAMTANAMEGDREKCLAVGMDDYVAKPVRLAELQRALLRS